MKMNTSQYQILNRFFSRQALLGLLKSGNSDLYRNCTNRFLKKDGLISKSNLEIIKLLYSVSKNYYRNEYFYKNTILNKLLLGRHSIRTTVVLNEIPIDKSKADFVLINGKAILYEIKSEVDNLGRLNSQINSYYKAFGTIYVVTHEKNEKKIIRVIKNNNVGVIVLNDKDQLSERRQAMTDNSYLNNESILKILRKNEYENIVENYYGHLPAASKIMYYRECLKLIEKIDTLKFYNLAIDELRKRNITNKDEYNSNVPYELKYPMYFSNLQKSDYDSMNYFLSANYGG